MGDELFLFFKYNFQIYWAINTAVLVRHISPSKLRIKLYTQAEVVFGFCDQDSEVLT
jgi:hypothetical protein